MNNDGQKRETEDYGGPADEDDMGGQSGGKMQGDRGSGGSDRSGDMGSGSGGGDGGQFGEFEDTGIGTDLTVEMENTDVRSGLVKGGEEGADDVAGPGQYGGQAGGLSK